MIHGYKTFVVLSNFQFKPNIFIVIQYSQTTGEFVCQPKTGFKEFFALALTGLPRNRDLFCDSASMQEPKIPVLLSSYLLYMICRGTFRKFYSTKELMK